MPTNEQILGFSNAWYAVGLKSSQRLTLPSGREIRIFPVPFILAAKIEAFKDRGKEDYIASKDLEDLVTLIDGRKEIRAEITTAPWEVRVFLANELSRLSEVSNFQQSLPGHLPHHRRNLEGIRFVLDIMRNIPTE